MTQPAGCTLTRRGYRVPLVDAPVSLIDMLRDVLTVTPKTGGMASHGRRPPQSFPVFLESPSSIYIPRAFGLKMFGEPPTICLARGAHAPHLSRFTGTMRPEQSAPVEAFIRAAGDPCTRGGIICLPCGAGKTVVALHIVSVFSRRTLIVAAKDFLLNQWKDRIEEFLPDASVGFLRAQTSDVIGRDIVLVSLQSLSMKTYPAELLCDFDFCIFDECHHLGAEVFSRALHKVATPVLMGLSATLDRRDGLRRVFEWYLGPVAYEAERESRSDYDVNIIKFEPSDTCKEEYGRERFVHGGSLNIARMLTELCAHRERTDKILDSLMERMTSQPGRKALILTDRRSHVDEMSTGLLARGVAKSDVGIYVGGMKADQLRVSAQCGFIVATFCMAAEGFDVPTLDTLLLASPVASVQQAIGRIGRSRPEARCHAPCVIDVVDDFSVFRSQAVKRRRFYVSRGYMVSVVPSTSEVAADCYEALEDKDEHDA